MKISKYAIVCLLMACLLVFTACQSSESNVTEPYLGEPDVRDTFNVLEVAWGGIRGNHNCEYDLWAGSFYEDPEAEKELTININGEYVTGTYWDTILRRPEIYTSASYNFDGGTFLVNEIGTLVVYLLSSSDELNEPSPVPLTQERCEMNAIAFLEEFVDLTHYRMEVEREEDLNRYVFTFTKYLNNIPTTDFVEVCVLDNGKIKYFTSINLGVVPSASNIMFDYHKAEQAVYQKLDTIYAEEKEEYDDVVYKMRGIRYTVLEGGQLGLYGEAEVEMIRDLGDGKTRASSGLVIFVIEM